MVKVSDVMTRNVPRVDSSMTVLEACRLMNEKDITGVAVQEKGKVVGVFTERSLLRRFVLRNKKPDEMTVSDVMAPLLKIDANASTREAANRMVKNGLTRLGVSEKQEFLGWVTLTDLAREFTKKSLLDALRRHHQPESEQVLCPSCRADYLRVVTDGTGKILRWKCPKCGFSE